MTEDTAIMHIILRDNIKKEDSLKKMVALATTDFSKVENRIKFYNYGVANVGYYALF